MKAEELSEDEPDEGNLMCSNTSEAAMALRGLPNVPPQALASEAHMAFEDAQSELDSEATAGQNLQLEQNRLVQAKAKAKAAAKANPATEESKYKPEVFQQARQKFMQAARLHLKAEFPDSSATEISDAANQAWVDSAERAEFLKGLSQAELKRRRFI